MYPWKSLSVILILCLFGPPLAISAQANASPADPAESFAAGVIYYVSSTSGNDHNDGLSPQNPLLSIAKANTLALLPGDSVLFKCGDRWQGEMLVITRSGAEGNPITFGSYPAGCSDKPVISGALPVKGWTAHAANIFVANLSAGGNAGKFPLGVNQLFRAGQRLTLGRWPNLDAPDGGYATIDAQASGNQITDQALPPGDWSGAVAHIRGMRWYILNREVTGSSGSTLNLGADAGCWGPCDGWGYFLNRHLNTLDREGEWYYDAATQKLYLYTTGGAPLDDEIEGSLILTDDDRSWGGVTLGKDLQGEGISYVVVENLALQRWYRHGIALPTNFARFEPHHITIRNNSIQDSDGIGINLATWVYDARDGRPDGWRGGYAMTVKGNSIDTANRMGINAYSRHSMFTENDIRDIGLIENLGAAGMGCSFSAGGGQCTEDGDGIRIKIDKPDDTGNNNVISNNRLERIAYNGMDVFGSQNKFERNLISQACYAKGDCGGVRTFGSGNLADTPVHDLSFGQNIIIDTQGNTDGCRNDFDALFGFGFYIDHYSRDIDLNGNTVISSTVHGALYANSTGSLSGNTFYNNSYTWEYGGGQVYLDDSPASLASHTGNVLFALQPQAMTLVLNDPTRFGVSDSNYFFNPYRANHIRAGGDKSLGAWQASSGKDAGSKEHWFTQQPGEFPRSRIFYNDSLQTKTFDLGTRQYLDLDQNQVVGSLSLAPFTARVLVDNGEAPLGLFSMNPTMIAAGHLTFTLSLQGSGFTPESVVRWGGSDRQTTFIDSTHLTAVILPADVANVSTISVRVFDPEPPPGGTQTSPLTFYVFEAVFNRFAPFILR